MAGTIVANTLNTDTAGSVFTTNNAYNGIAKAWVQFTGTTTPVVNASLNVSSITYVTTGYWLVNFATPFADTNYVGVCTAWQNARWDNSVLSTTQYGIVNAPYYGVAQTNSAYVFAVFFR